MAICQQKSNVKTTQDFKFKNPCVELWLIYFVYLHFRKKHLVSITTLADNLNFKTFLNRIKWILCG